MAALMGALLSYSAAQAYLTQIENKTSSTISVRINLAQCKSLDLGEIKPGKTSKLFNTGACCFESIHAVAVDGPLKGIESGVVAPWGKGWHCFQNIAFTCSEARTDGRTTHLSISHSTLKK